MADTAAHLCDRVRPHVPYRQWTLSLPRRTFVLRFGSLLNLNAHYHAVVPDGVF
jgi:hypothetical protein